MWNDKSDTREDMIRRRAGELYVERAKRGTFGINTYGVYIEGDDTLEGGTVTLGLFPDKDLAVEFLHSMKNSPVIELIIKQMFKHPESVIAIDERISISKEEWEQKHPDLIKYRYS